MLRSKLKLSCHAVDDKIHYKLSRTRLFNEVENMKKTKVDVLDFEKICSAPRLKTTEQETIQSFKVSG
jgi:hypothetical protein